MVQEEIVRAVAIKVHDIRRPPQRPKRPGKEEVRAGIERHIVLPVRLVEQQQVAQSVAVEVTRIDRPHGRPETGQRIRESAAGLRRETGAVRAI